MAPAAKRRNKDQSSGGLSEARKQMRLDALAEENAALREQLAALQAPTQVLKYVEGDRPEFLKDLNKSKGILMLDLSNLQRRTNEFIGDWYPKWKPDKRLDGTLASIVAATNEVQGLDLGDGSWAAADHYAQELVKILRKYSKTLTNVRVALSTLVERYETVRSLNQKGRQRRDAQVTIGKPGSMVLGGMTKLTTLKLIVNCVGGDGEHCTVAYDGEFVVVRGKKKLFNKLKELEVFLTDRWVRAHMGGDAAADDDEDDAADADSEDDSADSEDGAPTSWARYRAPRHLKTDPCLSDLLRHRGDVVTHLDMVPVGQGQSESPFVQQIAALTKLRSIALRAEMLGVTSSMKCLESLELHVGGCLSVEAVEKVRELFSTAPSLQGLQKLEIRVKQARVSKEARPLLAAVARHCPRLATFQANGLGWLQEDLAALLQGPAAGSLRELRLAQCGALEAAHLPMIEALPKLETVRLPSRLLGQPGAAQLSERDLDLQWQN